MRASRQRWREAGALGAAMLAAAVLRVSLAGQFSITPDEAFSVWISGLSLPDLLIALLHDIHPPLSYLLLKAWLGLFPAHPEIGPRSLSLAFGLLSVALVHWLGREAFDREVGLWAALLLAFSAGELSMDREGRMYSMVAALLTASTGFLVAWSRGGGRRCALGWLLCTLAALGTHHLAFFALVGFQAAWLGWLRRSLPAREWLSWNRRLAAAYLPLAVYPVYQAGVSRASGWTIQVGGYGPGDLLDLYFNMAVGMSQAVSAGFRAVVAGVFLALAAYGMRRGRAPYGALLGCLLGAPLLAFCISALGGPQIFTRRHLAFFTPLLAVALALGLRTLRRDGHRALAAGLGAAYLVLNLNALVTASALPAFRPAPWREVARMLDELLGERSHAVIVQGFYQHFGLAYYRGRGDLYFLNPGSLYPRELKVGPVVGRFSLRDHRLAVSDDRPLCELGVDYLALVLNQEWFEDPELRLKAYLDRRYHLVEFVFFPNVERTRAIQVWLYRSPGGKRGGRGGRACRRAESSRSVGR